MEATHGVVLPEDLRRWVTTVGHDGAGPGYGLTDLRRDAAWQGAAVPFPGLDALRRRASREALAVSDPVIVDALGSRLGDDWLRRYEFLEELPWAEVDAELDRVIAETGHRPEPVHAGDRYFLPGAAITGVVLIAGMGCGGGLGIEVTGASRGRVWEIDGEGMIWDTAESFAELYEDWLDSNIADLAVVAELMESAATTAELQAQFAERRKPSGSRVLDLMVSIMSGPRPPELVGPPHGPDRWARRNLWYEATFQRWRRDHGC